MAENWSNIESEPAVFTALVEGLGVDGIQFEELFDLSQLEDLSPVYGLVFLFKYEGSTQNTHIDYSNPNIFFARQVIQNSCATQAILSILLNNSNIDIGEKLKEFRSFCGDFDPETKGWAISNADQIRLVHNSFAKPDPFLMEGTGESSEDVFHFISYLPYDGSLWELDGLQSGPINHGSCSKDDWFNLVRSVIEKRIATYAANEIRFNLMA
ncbi:ubiquitin carboxyl-terminal hydrolase, partial [Nowakowskiella sp. JEL0078]